MIPFCTLLNTETALGSLQLYILDPAIKKIADENKTVENEAKMRTPPL